MEPGDVLTATPGPALIVGADGEIGSALRETLCRQGAPAVGTTPCRPPPPGLQFLELTDDPDGWVLPQPLTTAYLCAAISSLEACRQDPAGTSLVNVERTVELARRLVAQGAFVVFLSSSRVYDGSVPFRPASDPVCPTTEYGRQKAEAERRLLALGNRVAVVRLTKVLGPASPSFVKWRTILKMGGRIRAFSDMVMAPAPLPVAAGALVKIARLQSPGVFQISGDRDVTYLEAAERLADRIGADVRLVEAVETAASGGFVEANPAHHTLDMSRARRELDLQPPSVWKAIDLAAAV